MIRCLLCAIFILIINYLVVHGSAEGIFKAKAFVAFPSPTSSIFDWVPFKPSGSRQSTPLIRLKVRAINRVVYTKKDSLLKSVENVEEYKKEQEKQFEAKPTSIEEKVIRVNEPDKMYEKGEEPKIFLFPKQGGTVSKIGDDFGKEEVIGEENDDYGGKPKDDDFHLMYDDELKEYVLKRQLKMDKNGIIDSWNGGDSKEKGGREKVGEEEEGEDDEARRILESEEGGLGVRGNGTILKEKKKNFTEVTLEEEGLNLEDLEFKQHDFRPGKSKIRTYDLAVMDPRFLEKEEFSVRLTPQQRSDWRDKLINLTLLEERRADEHRDYGSSYILPVLKSVDYDNTSVPLAFNDIPVNVAVAFNFLYLANFDSEMMEFSMDVEMEFSWIDIRLVSNYTKPIRIREKPIIEQIWRPDPYIVNSKHSYFHYVSFPNIRMRITPEGLVTYTVRVSSVCSCFMSFCLYPHDRQECDLRIASIAYSNQYVKFHWHSNPIRFQSKITLPELHITKIKTGECSLKGKLVDASCLKILFSLERDSARFVIEKYVPSTLAMMFAWVAPYVPYNYEDVRIITPITVLLTLVQMEKGDKEIRTSYLTSIDVWFAAMKSFTVLSLLESLAVLALIKRSRAMTKNAERAANEFERCTFEAEAYRLNRLYHRVDSICRFSSPVVFVAFFVYYVLFIAQGNENCVQI
ncbi:CRE-LGC-43 protein [Caenorhabditis remanei]|uniref:CRE-LGC-43 protein n=1 Tax=Caenorhabditis remanei TaxID=31234 RepID=E3M5B9_CAERE|nr:CRE-LGC-43 protein [Caenorhabditis remanei]